MNMASHAGNVFEMSERCHRAGLPPDADQRVLDTLDWYSPRYRSKHTYEEIFRWFESCRLDSLRVNESPIAVRGHQPETSSEP